MYQSGSDLNSGGAFAVHFECLLLRGRKVLTSERFFNRGALVDLVTVIILDNATVLETVCVDI